jgi:hypothetical protein
MVFTNGIDLHTVPAFESEKLTKRKPPYMETAFLAGTPARKPSYSGKRRFFHANVNG